MDDPNGPSAGGGVYQIDASAGTGNLVFQRGGVIRESEIALSNSGFIATSSTDLNNFLEVFDPASSSLVFQGFLTGSVSQLGIYDLDFGADGELFAFMDDPNGPSAAGGIYQLDLVTGTGNLVFQRGGLFSESEIAISAVPEPGPLAVALIALCGLCLYRRKRAA